MFIYPHSTEPARCRYCLKPIAWAFTFPNRAKVPLDRPLTTKNLQADADGHVIAELVSTAHFATCPHYDPVTKQMKTKAHPIQQQELFS